MKLYLANGDEVRAGIELLAEDLAVTLVPEKDADVRLTVENTGERVLRLTFDGTAATITYGGGKSRFFRAFGMLCDAWKTGKKQLTVEEHPLFTSNGTMFDESRNAVMNVKTLKFVFRRMALMGLNSFMLYTEDTYEVPERPYFGYMRGRYTADEIRELDDYADTLGIELIPCIQTLGHLAAYLRWAAAAPCRDTSAVLLVGADETYALLEDLFRTVSACFRSRRVHVGMDETHDLGTGAYLDRFGYRERKDIYFEHLARVAALADKYGMKPMMWSDMFFRLSGKDLVGYNDYDKRTVLLPDIKKYIPANMQLVFWDYYHDNEDFYDVNLKKHATLGDDTVFGGGVWTWSGHAMQLSRSITNTVPALEACRKNGTKEVVATVWHNGSECSLIMALAGLQMYAEYDYIGRHDEDAIRAALLRTCGVNWDDFLLSERLEYAHGSDKNTGSSRCLLYNDPLCGLIDKHVEKLDTGAYFRALTPKLEAICNGKNGEFEIGFEILAQLCSFLENKADFGVRLVRAYAAGDRDTLRAMRDECDVMREKLALLRRTHRASWLRWNKPFGWDIHDIRYGGLDARLETAALRLDAYLSGEIDRLEELEEKRLRLDGLPETASPFNTFALWAGYRTIASANGI